MELDVSGTTLLLYIEIPTPLIWRAQSCHRAYAKGCEVGSQVVSNTYNLFTVHDPIP